MEMPGYHISERYADLLKVMWFVFLYGNLIPMTTVIFVIYLIFFYWVDKVNSFSSQNMTFIKTKSIICFAEEL